MRHLKKYSIFFEQKMIGYSKKDYLDSIELYHVGDHIYAIRIKDDHSRAMLFMRPQEFYESAFEEIIKKQFKTSRFMNMYKQHYGKQEFTYGDDWSGFNIPSDVLEDCMFNIDSDDINTYDNVMLSIISDIKKAEGDNKYYLLGVDELDNDLLEHEFAHAMYYTLPEYKLAVNELTSKCDPVIKDAMYKCITEYGYADHVLPDEMQAYMSTGLGSVMEEMDIPNIEEEMEKYREVFEVYYTDNLYKSPLKMDIKFNI